MAQVQDYTDDIINNHSAGQKNKRRKNVERGEKSMIGRLLGLSEVM